jgi:hypothetical protein
MMRAMQILGAARVHKDTWYVLILENGKLRFEHRKGKTRPRDAPKHNMPYEEVQALGRRLAE